MKFCDRLSQFWRLVGTCWVGIYGGILNWCRQGRREGGEQLLSRLFADLIQKHGRGFSKRNLEMMRMFYLSYPIAQTVSARFKLSWSHYCELLKEDNLEARAFYEVEAVENGWSMRELRRQMDALLYERLSLSRNKEKVKALAHKGQVIEKPEDAIKDPYILEFLGLKEGKTIHFS